MTKFEHDVLTFPSAACFSRRIVHRDLKPGNVLLGGAHYDVSEYSLSRNRAAFTGIVKVADFGLSRNLKRAPTAIQVCSREILDVTCM